MANYLRHKYALSNRGALDMLKAFVSCTVSYLVLMFPVGLLYQMVSDLMDDKKMSSRLGFYVGGILICLTLIALTTYIQYNATFLSTYKESGIRRVTLAERLRKIPLSFFGKKDLADLTSSIMSDCATLESASSHWISEFVGAVASTVIIAGSLFFFDWRMALAALWVLPVSFCIIGFSANYMTRKGEKLVGAKMVFADGVQECLEAVRDLKANNAEDEYMVGLDAKIKQVEKRTIITELNNAMFNGTARMILKFGIATTALVGGVLLGQGEITVLTFFMFLLVVSRIYDPMITTLDNFSAIISLRTPIARMNEILEHTTQEGADKLTNHGCDVVFEHVGFAYNKGEQVLRDVSFVAKQGEVTALIGPSGGGKTTCSRLAARFWDYTSGRITVGGMEVLKTDPETLMKLYSIVFQDVTLFNNTVLENIRIGRKDASDEEVIAAARLANCDEFVEKLPDKWNSMIGENGCELSGGERQRLSIARAFLKDAPIVLLDEATASLDVENESMIQESLSKLIRNKTVLIIAHRMRTVSGANQIVVLADGVVSQSGTPGELMKQDGIYRHMVELQNQSVNWRI